MTIRKFRNGAVGALLDEYEKAVAELKDLLITISNEDFIKVMDHETSDEDCRSIQTVMNHVVGAGYGYSYYIRKQFKDPFTERTESQMVETAEKACLELDLMMRYAIETSDNKYEMTQEIMAANPIVTRWGNTYDFEQLMEHAIVHILRHRRQIEKFVIKVSGDD